MVYAHLAEMQAQGLKTDLSGVRAQKLQEADDLSAAFQKLDLELKTQEAEVEAEAGEKMEQWKEIGEKETALGIGVWEALIVYTFCMFRLLMPFW